MTDHAPSSEGRGDGEPQGPTVRDKRRIDPHTYQVREPQSAAAPAPGGGDLTPGPAPDAEQASRQEGQSEVTELQAALAERTADLQRLQAEYINYKRRVDRDRDLVRKGAIEGVLKDFLSVLDDVRSAREHEELTGGFKAVGDEIERVTSKYGLEPYGEKGDPFDPHIHEALLHAHGDEVDGPTCVEILQPGYRIGDRILRPARVAVAEPAPSVPQPADAQTESTEDRAGAAADEPTAGTESKPE